MRITSASVPAQITNMFRLNPVWNCAQKSFSAAQIASTAGDERTWRWRICISGALMNANRKLVPQQLTLCAKSLVASERVSGQKK